MVEGELRVTGQGLRHRDPGRLRGVGAGDRLGQPWGDGQISRGNYPPPRVTIRRTVDTELFKVQLIRPQASLLGKLSMGGSDEVLLLVTEEAAGQRQNALIGLNPALNQKHMKTGFPQREDDEVNHKKNGRGHPTIVRHESTIGLLSL